ncbi:MAG: alginate export family protein [Bryobacteraceae bacterium]|nr:alginate export family protein [Bryobacteraceae bacterium]
MKNVRIGTDWSLTLGGETRQRVEILGNEGWGLSKPGQDSFYLQRYMLHADLRWRTRIRFFGQLKSGLVSGRRDGPRPVDADRLDVHQAFVEIPILDSDRWSLRVGRQEVSLGSSRLVSIREGPNVRFALDGARLIWQSGTWKFNVLVLRPVTTGTGSFDDLPDSNQSLWGVYSTKTFARNSGILDVYYLGLERKRTRFDSGFGPETRHSFGTRFSRRHSGWSFDYEAVGQTGTFAGRSIWAWTTGTNTEYTFESAPLKPEISLKADITSGDRNPSDTRLGTFNALFPKGNYFSQADVLGPYNLMDLHPQVQVDISKSISIASGVDVFWRHSTRDGLYNVPGVPIVPGTGSDARFVGHAVKLGVEWNANQHLSFESEYQRLFSGKFLREQSRPRSVDFFALWATLRF